MKSYLEASLSFLESNEMRDYLRKKLPQFRWIAQSCTDIVAYAPASIERKIPILEQIAREAEPVPAFDEEPFTADAVRFARFYRTALHERYNNTDGAMFWLVAFSYDGNASCLFDQAFFTGFDTAVLYLKKLAEEYPKESFFEGLSYTVTKCLPTDSGQMSEYCTWYLDNAQEIWYFDYEDRTNLPDGLERMLLNHDINLPVPFQPGDIVLADCLPYASQRRVLVLEVGDNLDCCCLQVMYSGEDGRLFAGAFKHNDFLLNNPEESVVFPWISGLYRASRWTGGLAAGEEPFVVLSLLVYEKPSFGTDIRDYIWEKGINGRSWPDVKAAFGL